MPSAKVVNIGGVGVVDLQDAGGSGMPGTRVPIADNDPLRAAYAAFIQAITPAANPTDIIQIQGSATKIVRIRSIVVTGVAASASNIFINTIRRSTLATGGSPSVKSLIARDNGDDAATAIVTVFGANPSALGTQIGSGPADGGRLNIAPAANGAIDRLTLQYSWYNDKAPILRGVNDCLCVNLGGISWPAGGALDFNIVLTEDAYPYD